MILPQPLMETFLQAPLWCPASAKFSTCRNRAKKERWMMEGTLNSSGFPASGLSRCLPRCVLRSGGFVALTLVYEDLAKLAALI